MWQFTKEYVGTFKVSVEDFLAVEDVQRSSHLDENSPDVLFGDFLPGLLVLNNFFVKVRIICKFHNKAKTWGFLLKKSFFVTDDGLVLDGGQNSNLVQRIFFFLLGEAPHSYLLESVDLPVTDALYLEDVRVGTLSYLLKDHKVTHRRLDRAGTIVTVDYKFIDVH